MVRQDRSAGCGRRVLGSGVGSPGPGMSTKVAASARAGWSDLIRPARSFSRDLSLSPALLANAEHARFSAGRDRKGPAKTTRRGVVGPPESSRASALENFFRQSGSSRVRSEKKAILSPCSAASSPATAASVSSASSSRGGKIRALALKISEDCIWPSISTTMFSA